MVKYSSLFSNICNWLYIQCKIKYIIPVKNDWGSILGVVSSLWAGWSRVLIPAEATDFPLPQNVQTICGPINLLYNGCWGSSLG